MDRHDRRSKIRQPGSVLVMSALLIPIFLGFAALALDGGYLLMVKNELQAPCDAAALAGAQELQTSSKNATSRALEYFRQNRELARPMYP